MPESLFITDFDRTLLRDDKRVSRTDLATLERLRETGVTTAIATGRSVYSFERAMTDMGIENRDFPVDYLLFSTGAGIMDMKTGTIIRSLSILKSDVEEITAYFDELAYDYMVHKAIPDTPYFQYKSHGRDNPDFKRRIQLYQPFSKPMNGATRLFESATQVLAIVQGGLAKSRLEMVSSDLARFSVIHATSPLDHRSSWIEVFHEKVSKSQSTAWLAAELNIPRSRVISVGNDTNDQDLLTWSGKGFAVSNAVPDLRDCTRLTASNNQSGVTMAAEAAGLLD
ncbi:MAG: Cof-type HAD-IIB family hydrolase [Desulfobacterales bacterium]|nr:Cof-type HAD-IIB family hydrolase [Desulfobacterales bacterium]